MKGQKTGGRTAGTPNRITSELRKTLKGIVAGEFESLPSMLGELPAKERLDVLIKLMPYCLPRVQPLEPNYDSGWNVFGD